MDDEGGSDGDFIDLGSWAPLSQVPTPEEKGKRRVEDTRARLAVFLLCILAGTILALLAMLAFKSITAEDFRSIAAILIAPIVGLVGAATGYYYGRGDR